jgi:hypothetical protein
VLFSPVYTEARPRHDAANAASSSPLKSFNFFTFNGFRTLVAQWSAATPVFSDASGLFPLQWGCTPLVYLERSPRRALSPSTAAPPISSISRRPSLFSSTAYKMLLPQLLCFDNHPFSWGVYTPLKRNLFREELPTPALCGSVPLWQVNPTGSGGVCRVRWRRRSRIRVRGRRGAREGRRGGGRKDRARRKEPRGW